MVLGFAYEGYVYKLVDGMNETMHGRWKFASWLVQYLSYGIHNDLLDPRESQSLYSGGGHDYQRNHVPHRERLHELRTSKPLDENLRDMRQDL